MFKIIFGKTSFNKLLSALTMLSCAMEMHANDMFLEFSNSSSAWTSLSVINFSSAGGYNVYARVWTTSNHSGFDATIDGLTTTASYSNNNTYWTTTNTSSTILDNSAISVVFTDTKNLSASFTKTFPVTEVIPTNFSLADANSGVTASGNFTFSGTASSAGPHTLTVTFGSATANVTVNTNTNIAIPTIGSNFGF